jgi:hypothetical protein
VDYPYIAAIRAGRFRLARYEPTVLDDIPARPCQTLNSKESHDVDQR